MTSLKTSIKTITYLSDTGCLGIQGASLQAAYAVPNLIVVILTSSQATRWCSWHLLYSIIKR
ncbi:hypothetical protein C5K17_25005 [Shigella dysenteriae]|nr:hypothetical protein C5K22_26350 [Shigella dysenteriae]PQN43736.1 hypothetical protein C5K17_25005 [Shigella dysenteriae]